MFDASVGGRLRIVPLLTALAEEIAMALGADTVGRAGRGVIGCKIGGCECGGFGLFGGIGEEVCKIGGAKVLGLPGCVGRSGGPGNRGVD